jgi:uncharacterized damage-inducible protein DinB
MAEFKTKGEILSGLRDANEKVTTWFENIPASNFFIRQQETWSASDNVDHLIRAHKPIIKALNLPRFALHTMFGKPNRESISYNALCSLYRDKIAKGGVASGSYLPDQQQPDDPEATKREILERWSSVSAELVARAEKWEENELDLYQLPHPLLGNLSVREILYFTLYHNLRHASLEGD